MLSEACESTDYLPLTWRGRITGMEGSNDSENGKYSIDLKEEGENRNVVVGFYEDEIKSIEVID